MTAAANYLKWKRGSDQVGCKFARLLAANPERFGQRLEVVNGTKAATIAGKIDTVIGKFVADPDVAAATILLPALKQLPTLVAVALALEQMSGWHVTRQALTGAPGGTAVGFSVTRKVLLPTGHTIPSEALVLGPFDNFPMTRRAPVTAMELFVGTPPAIDPKSADGSAPTRAYLAHIDVVPPLVAAQRDRLWEKSQKIRKASLGLVGKQDDSRAKAKIAFVVPLKLAQSLGCAP
jgi:hypothetical protein